MYNAYRGTYMYVLLTKIERKRIKFGPDPYLHCYIATFWFDETFESRLWLKNESNEDSI